MLDLKLGIDLDLLKSLRSISGSYSEYIGASEIKAFYKSLLALEGFLFCVCMSF